MFFVPKQHKAAKWRWHGSVNRGLQENAPWSLAVFTGGRTSECKLSLEIWITFSISLCFLIFYKLFKLNEKIFSWKFYFTLFQISLLDLFIDPLIWWFFFAYMFKLLHYFSKADIYIYIIKGKAIVLTI